MRLLVWKTNVSFQDNANHVLSGYTRVAGDDPTGPDTSAEKCAKNYYVDSKMQSRALSWYKMKLKDYSIGWIQRRYIFVSLMNMSLPMYAHRVTLVTITPLTI